MAAASYSCFRYKYVTVKVLDIFKDCHDPMLSNSAAQKSSDYFFLISKHLKISKLEIISYFKS